MNLNLQASSRPQRILSFLHSEDSNCFTVFGSNLTLYVPGFGASFLTSFPRTLKQVLEKVCTCTWRASAFNRVSIPVRHSCPQRMLTVYNLDPFTRCVRLSCTQRMMTVSQYESMYKLHMIFLYSENNDCFTV